MDELLRCRGGRSGVVLRGVGDPNHRRSGCLDDEEAWPVFDDEVLGFGGLTED